MGVPSLEGCLTSEGARGNEGARASEGMRARLEESPVLLVMRCRFDTLEETDVGFHVQKLLDSAGLVRAMTFDEFRDESMQRSLLG